MEFAAILSLLDLAAAVVFATTGALVASRKEMDILGFMWLGVITGIGGGTLRDLLLGLPVFWVQDATPVALCLLVAGVVHFSAHRVSSRYRLLLYLDAFGMALVTIAGAAKGLDAGAGPLVALVMGVITASFGGILRDLLGQEPSILLRRDIYVSASAAGAALFLGSLAVGLPREGAMAAGLVTAAGIRGLALWFNWSLPVYRARPGRAPDERGGVK
ncbi:trimeric intracellular cation channel family protein [Tabrizicola oligotrophica]|uniref:Trimeric intracellular cation channel family protein n=1 Tax=Tabrizicola oligotrophica TaxID=2710650 RepID=A0A6M0QW88_9RHOB|nr:trimeric intracellular cation channel family protein [Tabrizicola oligotrophica]NEY90762.1 trimeric intracellular cation channel family protein [Tabrizicola oligotrophica]